MSSSDPSGSNLPVKRDWHSIRSEYETTHISQRALADKRQVPYGTLFKRAMREGWSQRAKLIHRASKKLEANVDQAIQTEIHNELSPWIEERKREITKRGFNLAVRGLNRAEQFMDASPTVVAREESYISRAFESYLRAGRTSLGMNDGTPTAGSLNLNILTNHSAVQIVPS